MGFARFSAARHRLLGPGPTRWTLRRYDRRQFHQDYGRELLLVHRARPARGEADDQRRLAADHDLLWRREMDAALQRDGACQGGPGILGEVSRRRSWRQK